MTRCLVDSNILLRLVHQGDPQYAVVRSAVLKLRRRGYSLYIIPQCLAEFWSVTTRPSTARGGYGLTPAEAHIKARLIERRFPLLQDRPEAHRIWRRMVISLGVQGAAVHDARIVAAMRAHGIDHLLTLDAADFARYPGITALDPSGI